MTIASASAASAFRAGIAGWILFDWSLQPFFTLVTVFIYGPYFVEWLAPTPAEGQALWGYATAAAGLAIALLSPPLGAIADAAGRRKPWIAAFGLLMMISSAALWFAAPGVSGAVALVVCAFALGTIGAEFATMFNNAQMPGLVPPEHLGWLSGTGWAVGYAGGVISLLLTLGFLAASPLTGRTLLGLDPLFGLDPASHEGDRVSGPFSALWFAIFALPMFLFTPDGQSRLPLRLAMRDGLRSLLATVIHIRTHRNLWRFLLANMIYTDGLVALFAFGGIYGASIFGWSTIELGLFGILITVTGIAGAYLGGRLDDRIGSKSVLAGALVLLIAASVAIISIDDTHILFLVPSDGPTPGDGLFASTAERVYVGLGCLIGVAAGPLQASSRTLLARLAPSDRLGECFGLFALSGKLTSLMGPLAVGVITDLTMSQRKGISVLVLFFVVGLAVLSGVRAGHEDRAPG
jgi:UMF1 family MFS transporter